METYSVECVLGREVRAQLSKPHGSQTWRVCRVLARRASSRESSRYDDRRISPEEGSWVVLPETHQKIP